MINVLCVTSLLVLGFGFALFLVNPCQAKLNSHANLFVVSIERFLSVLISESIYALTGFSCLQSWLQLCTKLALAVCKACSPALSTGLHRK